MTQINACTSYTIEDGIAVITSDNPPVNALSHAVRDGLMTALAAALADDTVQAIVITCAGRTFFAGADITEFGRAHAIPGSGRGDRASSMPAPSPSWRASSAPLSAAGWKSPSAAITASPWPARGLACRKSSSASCPAPAARSACPA